MVNLTETLDRPGCALHYADLGGDGPALLLSHGAGADHHMFDHQAHHLTSRGHRVVVWDMRGHGVSRPNSSGFTAQGAVDDVLALIQQLELDRPILAGHSLGGNLSQNLVRRSPDDFRGLIVMDSTWNTGPLTRVERLLLSIAAPSLSLIPARSLPRIMARASAVTSGAQEDAVRAFSQMSKQEFIAVWRATTEFVAPDSSYTTPVPLCLIRGEKDSTGNIATAMPQWAEFEGVGEHVVPGAGHLVTQDAPHAVSAILESFLTSVKSGE
ncbi:alpha/beta fold hydrolase [Glaciibacter superstes]|uniref:alpha/beta fold hydrolase n=1 Tax=Glaciibacter superstes TaxID=501023 RepID=UPI0003B34C59|nr:alpha/beta hydrolase [Glaciibacter superstes]